MPIPRRPSTMPIPWAVPLHDANSVNIFPAMPIPRTSIQAYRDANSARVFHDANSVDSFLHDANSVNIFPAMPIPRISILSLSRCQFREGLPRCQFRGQFSSRCQFREHFLSRCQSREGHSRCQSREWFYHLRVKLPCNANSASSLVPINY